jgi:SRSO17 transposase
MEQLNSVGWGQALSTFMTPFGQWFKRSESRQAAQDYVRGLLAEVKRKNCWQMAEKLGASDPQALQRLLYQAEWDAEAVSRHLRITLIEQLGYEPGVGVIDESGFVKKGQQSAGVQRQYCGRLGKVENCQVGVFLGYVSPQGHALLDRELYLPQDWAADETRREAAKIPQTIPFQTKPQLAQQMLERAWAEGIPLNWVAGDTTYGNSPTLREAIHHQQRQYVLQVAKSMPLRPTAQADAQSAEQWASLADGWQRLAFNFGEKGLSFCEWQAWRVYATTDIVGEQWLLIRRSLSVTPDVTYHVSNASADTPLATLAQVASARHQIEQLLEEAKGSAGLADYEVRYWHSWYRHMTLALVAHAFITLLRHADTQKKSGSAARLVATEFC